MTNPQTLTTRWSRIIKHSFQYLFAREKTFYCQRDIEDESICNEQCEHCKEYYKPLELNK